MSKEEYNIELLEASKDGNLQHCIKAIEKGATVNAIDLNRKTPLHYAALKGNLEILKYLFKKGANIDSKDANDGTPLHVGALNGNSKIVQYLLEKGADINALAIYHSRPLHYSIFLKSFDCIKLLIENGATVTQDMIDQATKQNSQFLTHLFTAKWCQNVRVGRIEEIPSNLGEDPISLLAKIMNGQLAEEGSADTLKSLQSSENPIIQGIIRTNNFAEDTTKAIINKHAVRLCNSISFGKKYDKPGLDTLSPDQQGIVVNKVKSLCAQRGITSYENAIETLKGDNVPNLIKSELEAVLKASEGALEGVGSFVIGTIKGESIAPPGVEEEFKSLTNGEIIVSSKSSHTLFDLKKEDLRTAYVASNLQYILNDQETILPINIRIHLENLISDYVKDLAATQIQKAFRDYSAPQELASKFDAVTKLMPDSEDPELSNHLEGMNLTGQGTHDGENTTIL